jgi:DNA repair exonuclease SbcCD ATPase subunit
LVIKSIALNNFRQYKGEQPPLVFQQTREECLVILGVNTSGKTH